MDFNIERYEKITKSIISQFEINNFIMMSRYQCLDVKYNKVINKINQVKTQLGIREMSVAKDVTLF